MANFIQSDLSKPKERRAAQIRFVQLNQLVTRPLAEKAVDSPTIEDPTSPLELLAAAVDVIPAKVKKDAHLAAVTAVIAGSPYGADFLNEFPDLPKVVLFKAYRQLGVRNVQELRSVDPQALQDTATDQFKLTGEALYKDHIGSVLNSVSDKNVSEEKVNAVYKRLSKTRISPFDPRFRDMVVDVAATAKEAEGYEVPFEQIKTELKDGIGDDREEAAIQLLQEIGVKSDFDKKDDWVGEDWARLALGVVGGDGPSSDIMTAAYTSSGLSTSSLDAELPFPEFESDVITGLKPENIRTCADLYYIHTFDRLGVFRYVDALAAKFFDSLNLGLSDTARKFYVYIKRRSTRFPDEDRQRITTHLFEEGPFKELFGRMVEAVVEYARAQNAGEFFTNGAGSTSIGTATTYTLASVRRTVQNLQRYLSMQGGIAPFLARESGRQLLDCFDILKSPDLQQYYGGTYSQGMWGIIEAVGQEVDGKTPDVDRMRTLAVHGRRIIKWLSENTSNAPNLTDSDVATLVNFVQNWLAAFRRPELDPQPDWMQDDDGTDGTGIDADKLAKSAISDAMKDATGNGNGTASADDSKKPDVLGVA
jgi:hypothetical protein